VITLLGELKKLFRLFLVGDPFLDVIDLPEGGFLFLLILGKGHSCEVLQLVSIKSLTVSAISPS
jgi:hypothetical protein